MQPQETGFDWMHAASAGVGTIAGAASTILAWVIRAARLEPKLMARIAAAEARMDQKIIAAEKRNEMKIDEENGHFRETLHGIREQINKVDRNAITRDDLKQLREEYREDFSRHRQESREDAAELKRNIAEIVGQHK